MDVLFFRFPIKSLTITLVALAGLCLQPATSLAHQSESSSELVLIIPDMVKTAFNERYTSAQNVQWENQDQQFKATFQQDGKNKFAFFKQNGTWIKSFTKIETTDLPPNVMLYIQEYLDGYELSRHYLRADTNTESYAVAVKKGTEYVWIEFDLDGKFKSSQV